MFTFTMSPSQKSLSYPTIRDALPRPCTSYFIPSMSIWPSILSQIKAPPSLCLSQTLLVCFIKSYFYSVIYNVLAVFLACTSLLNLICIKSSCNSKIQSFLLLITSRWASIWSCNRAFCESDSVVRKGELGRIFV